MKKEFLFILYLFISTSIIRADSIEVFNHIDEDIFIATYYKNNEAHRIYGPIKIPANSCALIERGERKWHPESPFTFFLDRELFFDTTPENLHECIAAKEINKLFHVNVGSKQGTKFHIWRENEILQTYNAIEWLLKKTISNPVSSAYVNLKESLCEPIKKRIISDSLVIMNNPYNTIVAHVRKGNDLPEQEQLYRKKRKPKVKKALEKFLGQTLRD